MPDDILDIAEKAGASNMAFHIDNGDSIASDSATTLTILLTGGGASLGYWMKLLELGNHPTLSWGVASVSFYLFILAYTIILQCLMIRPLEAPTNEPANLLNTGLSVEEVRAEELQNLQERIVKNIERNEKTGWWLNCVRMMLIFAPVVFLVGLVAATIFHAWLGQSSKP